MKQILIAEDDPDIADVIVQALGDRLAVETQVVPNGALVPDALTARSADLVILDVALPGLNGLDVFDVVRSDPRWQGVPILFLTGSPDRAAAAFAPTGVHRVMGKPFDLDTLIGVVGDMVDDRAEQATPTAAD